MATSTPSPSTDYAFLRKDGLRHLERVAGHLWTDFNAHDPGVTILEQLCYAITDLGYRAAHELPDLLSEGGADSAAGLFSAARILTGAPVTLGDLRRLVLDVRGVKNAWIEHVEKPEPPLSHEPGARDLWVDSPRRSAQPVRPKGLYRVSIEKSAFADIDGSVIKREAARRFLAHRGLCEDLDEVRILAPQDVELHARVKVEPTDDPEGVAVDILQAVQDYLSPHVRFRTLDEMRARGKSIDAIFNGPALEHGFIDDETLAGLNRRTAIHRSDLLHAIMEVKHVKAVRDVRVAVGAASSHWSLNLDTGLAPRLDDRRSSIGLEREHGTISLQANDVAKRYREERRKTLALQPLPLVKRDLPVPRGRDRKVANYHSIQHQFPAAYGVGAAGLAASAAPERKARAKQLKAYLLIFDQILANGFAQLASARELLSFKGQAEPTYFSRMIEDASLGLEEVRVGAPADHKAKLLDITNKTGARSRQRKNRFLSHLMARFGEEFSHQARGASGGPSAIGNTTTERRVQIKEAFLARYPEISGARGSGYDTLSTKPEIAFSSLEERLRLELGLDPAAEEYFYLIEHILLRPVGTDRPPAGIDPSRRVPLMANANPLDPYSLQLTFVFPDWPARFKEPGFWSLVGQTVRAQTPAHLTPYLQRLSKNQMDAFKLAYTDWLRRKRAYETERLGL